MKLSPEVFMSHPNPDHLVASDDTAPQENTSFAEILSSFEQQHSEGGAQMIQGTVISVTPDAILVDIGRKTEGALSISTWQEQYPGEQAKVGDTISVIAGPRNQDGYYQLSSLRVERPRDWSGLQHAFSEKRTIAGTVEEQVKGGFRVDIGVRAFMPASRSGVRDVNDLPGLVGQEIQCRITKLDVEKEDVVVDRRIVLEEEQAKKKDEAFASLLEGAVVQGRVRNVMDFGAFIDIGGVDGLLHLTDISWNRLGKASELVKPGDELTLKVLKVDPASRKISLGLKQLQEDPWTIAARTFEQGQRVTGTVSRLTDFGAFVELLPGVDGLIHLSEMTWDKRVRKPSDVLKPGDRVEAVVLQVSAPEKRISLGLKQAIGDPWEVLPQKHPVGSTVEGPITNIAPFGVFIDLGDGIEGMIHISDITGEKRLQHPRELLSKGQTVRATILELDRERRRVRLGMRQLEPTKADHYIAEHKVGEVVSGRIAELAGDRAKIELAEGVVANCSLRPKETKTPDTVSERTSVDVSALGAMLAARWKQGPSSKESSELAREGQIRTFRITALDSDKRLIEIEFAS
jgi:small subunit ribosomal protein S1